MSTYDLLAAHAAALEAAGIRSTIYIHNLSEQFSLYQAARARLAMVSAPMYGASAQLISGARRRVENRWDGVLLALSIYDAATTKLFADTSVSGALDEALLEAPSIMATVQMEAPRRDEVSPAYDSDYAVSFKDAPEEPEEKKPEPKPTHFATIATPDVIAAAMAQLRDLPDRVSDWPDPAGLLADVKPAPAGDYHLIEMDDRTVIVNDAGDVVADDSEVPF